MNMRYCTVQNRLGGFLLLCLCLAMCGLDPVRAESVCRRRCPQSDYGLLQYTPGHVYEYKFESTMTVGLDSQMGAAKTDGTNLMVEGRAQLFVEGNCGYTLQLSSVKVNATKEPTEKNFTESIQKTVHFTMVGGTVLPEICIDPSDNTYALNIKRGIISLFNSNTKAETEVDVFGQCRTHSSVSKIGGADIVTKIRNLDSCGYREHIRSGVLNGVINEKSSIKSTTLLQGDYFKEVKVERGEIENIHMVEEYKFSGTANSGSGAYAKVVTTLKLRTPGGNPAAAPTTGSNAASIIFEEPEIHTSKNFEALKSALGQTVQLIENYVQKNAGKHFVKLIRLMRNADLETLLNLDAFQHTNKVLARKVYLDALFRTGTAESAKAVIKQLITMDDKEKKIAMLSLNLLQTVDKETLNQAAGIVTTNSPREVYLAVGHIVSKYCAHHICEQGEIDLITKKFIEALKHCKVHTKKDEERIVHVLKGIQNSHHMAGSCVPVLAECATMGLSSRIRVAALQAFSSAKCNSKLQKKALELLGDRNEDSELRIEAYLAAIDCPTPELANQIAEIVNTETVYQVGGFISSNLKAIRDSTDSTRENQRHYLANVRVIKQFPKDYRRYSFNDEISYKLDSMGASASADYKLIYSQFGFLPRSARLNVTSEIFGTNYNVFEVSIRQENLEHMLEYYLGPKGLLNRGFDGIVNIIQTGSGRDGSRSRRSIADDSAKFTKKYKTYGSKNIHDLKLDLSLKLFGSEMFFMSLDDNIPSTVEDVVKCASTIFEETKTGVSSFSREFNMHSLIIDMELIYPTGLGFPLQFSAQGFAANKLDFGVELDVDAIVDFRWKDTKYRLKIVPSVDVNLNVELSLDTDVIKIGARVVSSLHSATGSDLRLEIGYTNVFNLDIELPRKKIELIDLQINTDLFIAEQHKDIKSIALKAVKKRKQEPTVDCFNHFEIVGFSICFAIAPDISKSVAHDGVTVEDLELIQPFSFTLYITSERRFNVKTKFIQNEKGNIMFKLDYSTPGSKAPHDTTLAFELTHKISLPSSLTYARATFDHPQYHYALEAGYRNNNEELVLYGQYESNRVVKKNRIGFMKNGNVYRPIIEMQGKDEISNEIVGLRADGRIVVQQIEQNKVRYNFENLQVVNKKNDRAIANGWIDVGPSYLNCELRMASNDDAYLVKSNLELENKNYLISMFVNDDKTPKNVMGGMVYLKRGRDNVSLDLVGKARTWGVEFNNELKHTSEPDDSIVSKITSIKFKNNLSIKNKNNIMVAFKLDVFTEGRKKMEVDAEIVSGKKIGSVAVKYSKDRKVQEDYHLEINGKLNKHFVDLLATADAKGSVFYVNNVMTTSWGTSLTAKGELSKRFTAQDVHIDLQGNAHFSTKRKPVQLVLKVTGAPEKTSSEFKLTREKAELIKYIGEFQHPVEKITSGKINLQVKSMLSGSVDIKIAKNGKGELNVNAEILKFEPKQKIEANTKFHIQAPKYYSETAITLDDDKKIYFKTENIIDNIEFTTKNIAEIGAKKASFDANGFVKGEWRLNGEIQGSFALTSFEGRVLDSTFTRKVTMNPKTGISQGNWDVQLNDLKPNGGAKRTLKLASKLERGNYKAEKFSVDTHGTYTDFTGKRIDLNYHIKHLYSGQKEIINFGVFSRGDILNVPFDISLTVDEYCSTSATYRLDFQCCGSVLGNINGNYSTGARGKPASYQIQSSITVPKSSLKTIEVQLYGELLQPEIVDGTYVAEMHINERTSNETFFKFNAVWKGSVNHKAYYMELQTKNMEGPLKIEGFFQKEKEEYINVGTTSGMQKYTFSYNYAANYMRTISDISYSRNESASFHFTLDSSFDMVKDVDMLIRGHKLDTESYMIHMQAKQAESTYTVETKFFGSTNKKGLDIHATLTGGKPIVLVGIYERLGERKVKLTVDIGNFADLDVNGILEASYNTIADFYVVGQWKSVKLNLDNYDLNIRSQGKAIVFNLKNAQGVVSTGSATYAFKKEKNKSILEGQGHLQCEGKNQNANFKMISQHYEVASDKEIGFSYTFNGNFGPKNSVSTLKITNKDFNVKLSVCEEKKQCTNIQVQSIVIVDQQEIGSLQHSLLVLIDLRELGYPHEFELQSKTIRKGLKSQYSLNSNIISNDNIKYQLVANVLPTSSDLQIKLPTREIALETKKKYPLHGEIFGHYEHTFTFYIDKTNKPNYVTRFVATADITGTERVAINAKGHLKFEHPSIRPLTISGKLDASGQQHIANTEIVFDIFRVPEQQVLFLSHIQNTATGNGFNITVSKLIQSDGLGFKYGFNGHSTLTAEREEFTAGANLHFGAPFMKTSAYIFGNMTRIEVMTHLFNEKVVQFVFECNRQKYTAKINSQLQIFGQKPIALMTELHPPMAKFSIKREGLLDADAEIKLGNEAKFNILGNGKDLYNGHIFLDAARFLQATSVSNDVDVKHFLELVETEVMMDTETAIHQIKKRFEKMRIMLDGQIQSAQNSSPDFSQLKASYENNIKQILTDLEGDPYLKELIDTYRKMYVTIAKIATDTATASAESYEKFHKSFTAIYTKGKTIIKDVILPMWEELCVSLVKILGELRVKGVNIYTKALQSLLKIMGNYGPTLKSYGKVINEFLKPFHEGFQELYKFLIHATEEVLDELKEQIAKLPTLNILRADLKQKFEKMKIIENVLEFINAIFKQTQILHLTPETRAFLQKLHELIEAKLTQKLIDYENLVEEFVDLYEKALHSVFTVDMTPVDKIGLFAIDLSSLISSSPFSLGIYSKLPVLLSLRFSVINSLLTENLKNIISMDIFKSWVFFDKFHLTGHVADGRHIFTFDGGRITFPGTCKYILAQDSFDNNFTVIAHQNNGKLKSIIITDRDGMFMEINDSGVLKLNGAPIEFPQHTSGIHAWRKFYTVWMFSDYGVQVMCTTDLKVCHVDVSGFYTSKTRGLLGNGNAEPNDDFILADGAIAPDLSSFGNSYGIGKCNFVNINGPVKPEHTELCNEIFGHDSPLAFGFLFVNSAPFRSACDSAVLAATEKDKEAAACTIGLTYGSAVNMENFFVSLPSRCFKCTGTAGQHDIGQEFTSKIPNTKADVLFIVDTGVTADVIKHLVAPVIIEIREALKTRGLTDVQVAAIAYNEEQKYPALLTSDNGKLNFEANFTDVKLTGPKTAYDSFVAQVSSNRRLLKLYELIKSIIKNLVPQADEKAFRMAVNYPFRAAAAKTIIAIRSKSLEYRNLFKLMRTYITGAVTNFDGAILHVISPVKDMALEGVPAEKLVGFNSRLLATLDGKDNKKRLKLQFHNDMGIDFVLDNGGWVFSTHHFDMLNPEDQRKMINQITNTIADTLFKTEIVNDCKCVSVHGLHAQHRCSIKSSTFVPNKKPKLA